MAAEVRYRALIVEPDLGTRNRLKQAAVELREFQKIEFSNSAKEAIERLSDEAQEPVDVFFISYRFKEEEARSFIDQAKTTRHGEDGAYITLMKSFDHTGAAVASKLLNGADGVLQEPYSIDGLKEVTQIAARVKRDREAIKAVLAVKMLAKDVAKQFELFSFLKRQGLDTVPAMRSLREKCSQLQTLSKESQSAYLEQAIDVFADFPLLNSPFDRYTGRSDRVKKRMAKVVAEDLSDKLK